MEHPIVRIKGHIAIIAPNFAKNIFILPKHCSVYKFLGNFKWEKFSRKNNPIKITLL
jgi:hypothetical protein